MSKVSTGNKYVVKTFEGGKWYFQGKYTHIWDARAAAEFYQKTHGTLMRIECPDGRVLRVR
jgi:hypothetical protein